MSKFEGGRACEKLARFGESARLAPPSPLAGEGARRADEGARRQAHLKSTTESMLRGSSAPLVWPSGPPSPARGPLRDSVRSRFDAFAQMSTPVVPGRSASQDARRGRESNMESNELKPYWIPFPRLALAGDDDCAWGPVVREIRTSKGVRKGPARGEGKAPLSRAREVEAPSEREPDSSGSSPGTTKDGSVPLVASAPGRLS